MIFTLPGMPSSSAFSSGSSSWKCVTAGRGSRSCGRSTTSKSLGPGGAQNELISGKTAPLVGEIATPNYFNGVPLDSCRCQQYMVSFRENIILTTNGSIT